MNLLSLARIALASAVFAVGTLHAELVVVHSQWVGDWGSGQAFAEETAAQAPAFGILLGCEFQIFLHNAGATSAGVESLRLDGQEVSAWQGGEVVWHRLLPSRIPPGGTGQYTIRFRVRPAAPCRVDLNRGSDTAISLAVDPAASSRRFRFDRVAFDPREPLARVYLRSRDGKPLAGIQVSLPDDAAAHGDVGTAQYFRDICAVDIGFAAAPALGSYLYLKAQDEVGETVACLSRVTDGFMPLGSFDGGDADLPAFVRAGLNTLVMHGGVPRSLLDQAERLGIRVIADLKLAPPGEDQRAHPAVWSYLIVDEPDMLDWQYHRTNPATPPVSWGDQVGHHAPRCVETYAATAALDPMRPLALNLDMTYKPDNWYTYGHVPDVFMHDNYPLMYGGTLNMTWRTQREVRSAAAPNPTVALYQNCHWAGEGIDRRMAPGELVRLMLYPLGEGAQGLIGWWNVTAREPSGKAYWSTDTYPDLWDAQSSWIRTLSSVAPWIATAFPLGAVDVSVEGRDRADVWARALWVPGEGILLVLVNERYESRKDHFTQTPAVQVACDMPLPPGTRPVRAVRLAPEGFSEVPLNVSGDAIRVEIDRLVDGALVLLPVQPKIPEALIERERGRQEAMAVRLLAEERRLLAESGAASARNFDLALNRSGNRVMGEALTSDVYQISRSDFWPESGARHNAFEWYSPPGATGGPSACAWAVDVREAGRHVFVCQSSVAGPVARLRLVDSDGESLAATNVVGPTMRWPVAVPIPGAYRVLFEQDASPTRRERCVRLARSAYWMDTIGRDGDDPFLSQQKRQGEAR